MSCTDVDKIAFWGLSIYLARQAFNKRKWEVCLNQALPVTQEMWLIGSMSSMPAEANRFPRVAVCLLKQA